MVLGFSTGFENLMGTCRTSILTKNVKKGQVLSALANCSHPETVEGFNPQTTAIPPLQGTILPPGEQDAGRIGEDRTYVYGRNADAIV